MPSSRNKSEIEVVCLLKRKPACSRRRQNDVRLSLRWAGGEHTHLVSLMRMRFLGSGIAPGLLSSTIQFWVAKRMHAGSTQNYAFSNKR